MLLPNYEELVNLKTQSKPVCIDQRMKASSLTAGNHTSLFKGRGLDFSEFREYAPGDDIRSIDWRVTARTGRAHTKLFTEERERSVYIFVDINRYMDFGTRSTFKSIQAARAAAIIAWRANALRDKTGAILFGNTPERIQFLNPTRSRKSIWEMFKVLCEQRDFSNEVKIEDALLATEKRIGRGSTIFIISDFFEISPEFETQLGILSKRCDVTLIKVSDPADRFIPDVAEIRFSDDQGSSALVNTHDSPGNEEYQRIWKKSDTALQDLAHRFRTKLIQISTDRDVGADLFRNTSSQERSAPDENGS